MKRRTTLTLFVFAFLMLFAWNTKAQFFQMDAEEMIASPQKTHYDALDPDNPANDPEKVKQWHKEFVSRNAHKIVGGEDVDIEDYPWQVSLQMTPVFGGGAFCGGTIISEEWIVTAAHCLLRDVNGEDFELTPTDVRIRAGFTAMNNPAQGSYYQVEEIILHPGYTTSSHRFDIALVRLASAIDFNHPGKAPVALVTQQDADNGMTDHGVMAKVSGWGALSSGGPSPNILQAIEVPVITSGTSYPPNMITPDMIMAGASGQDACQGDSGGPMVIEDGNGWYKLAGVVSWGVGCGEPGYPGVYARVSYFEDWLAEYIFFPDPNQFYTFDHEDFGDGQIPQGWVSNVIAGPANFPGWEWTTTGGDFGGQLNSSTADNGYMILDSDAHGSGGVAEEVDLISAPYDFTEITGNISFSAEHWARTFGTADVRIYVSNDDFTTQTELYRWHGAPQNEANGPNPVVSVFDVTDVAQGQSDVKFKFKWLGSYDYWWLVDDVRILIENTPLQVQFVVTDGEATLADAIVTTGYTGQHAVTDNDGIAFLTLYEGDYTISVNRSGFFPFTADITVTEDGQIVNLELEKIPAPEIEIDLTVIEVDVNQGTIFSTLLNIANPGDAELEFSLLAYPADGESKANMNQNPTAHYEGFDQTGQSIIVGTTGYSYESENHKENLDADRYDEFIEIHHDLDDGSMNGIGAGANSWISAVRFDAEDMSPYASLYELSHIRFHLGSNTFTHVEVKIWEGGTEDGPQTEIYSQNVTDDVSANSWNIHELPENISILPGVEYWFGYAITSTGQFPASADAGPMVAGKGCWIYFGNNWSLLPDLNSDFDYNWRIRGGLQLLEQVDWLTIDPQTGTVAPESDVDIQLTFDVAGMELGQYFASLLLQNNAGPAITIPVTLNVLPAEYDVTFEVKDPEGVVVDNAVVTLGSITNAEGDYFFEDIMAGEYVYSVAAEGFNPAGGIVGVNQDMTVEVMLIAEDADVITLTVTIEDEFEVPQQDVMFILQGFGGHYTNAAGQVVLTLVPGTFAYQATKTGFEPVASNVVITDDENQTLDIAMDYLRFNVEVTALPEEGGIVAGAGEYYYGQTVGLDALANIGYHFIQWNESGTMVSDDPEFFFEIFADRSFEAIFFINVYTITATAGANGSINPSGDVDVEHGEDITFAILPNAGYDIEDVLVNGESVGAVATFTFEDVTEDATIHAEFVMRTYEVNVTSEGNGTITPFGTLVVDHGSSITFELEPEDGHHVGDLLINGNSVGWHYTYTLSNIQQDTDVHALFSVGVGVDELTGESGMMVYPNPATSLVTIESSYKLQVIELYNISGQLVKSIKAGGNTHSLNVSALEQGVYMIRVVTHESTQVVRLKVR